MNEQWKQYLQRQGANFTATENRIEHFANDQPAMANGALTTVSDGNIITAIVDTAIINATGEDAKSFLQGQLTNDIGLLDQQHSQLSGYCNPKGRLLALFRITQHAHGYWLHLPTSLVDKTLSRLKMFVLMAKVNLEVLPSDIARIGIAGNNTAPPLRKLFNTIPQKAGEVCTVGEADNITVIRLPGAHPRFEIITDVATMQQLWHTLSANFTPLGSGAWQLLNIEAGQPCVVAETVEMFIPQMLNLDLIDGVSFKKGCYPGQEVVARLHYRGKLKRHMHLVQFSTDHCPPPGTSLYAVNDDSDSPPSIGSVVVAEPLSASEYRALCVIANEHAHGNGVCLQGDTKITFKLHDLPYSCPPENR